MEVECADNIIILSDTESNNSSGSANAVHFNTSLAERLQYEDDFDFPSVNFDYISERGVCNTSSQDLAVDLLESEKIGNIHYPSEENHRHKYKDKVLNNQKKRAEKKNNEKGEKGESAAREKARQKTLKQLTSKNQRNLKPEEAIKYITIFLDEGIKSSPFTTDLESLLQENNIKYVFKNLTIPYSVTWERNSETYFLDEFDTVQTIKQTQTENTIIIIWNWEEVVSQIADGSFTNSIANICDKLSEKFRMTLVITGMETYFSYKKKTEKNKRNKSKKNTAYEKAAKISRKELETCLAEIQITHNITSRLLETNEEIALIIYQFTKAIAQLPYKMDKMEKIQNMDWYVFGDNKDTVNVDKDGYGLKRLWERQLCQFNLSKLETAQSISFVFPSPSQLMDAYMNCTKDEGEMLLKDIPIRRTAGPLTTSGRKIGPEMSKKIYTMFTSEDGNEILNN